MAKVKKIVSDLSGEELSEKELVLVTIVYPDGSRVTLDVGADEVRDLAAKGRKLPRRGRPPGAK